jgi:hypothetical protein
VVSLALGGCLAVQVRVLATGRSHLVTDQLSQCGLDADVTWNPISSELVFAYGNPRNVDALPAGCALATAAADRASKPASWR